ncbi:MAG: exopolysaccharide biosynthesis protein [Hyphomonadaceae bacterium]|jgi:hypothetical protein|nr:exopolysaccharide biosynthesis protein [Hyphomonadaceae bacterium]
MLETDPPARSFIDTLQDLRPDPGAEHVTLEAVIDRLDERAFGLLILVLTIPCLVPGLPGAQLIAIPIFLLAAQLAVGRTEPWLPRKILDAKVKSSWLVMMADFADKRMRWTLALSKPRLALLAAGAGERLVGLIIALAAITIALPITNTIPSLAITLAAVGLIQRDGLFTLAGMALGTAWVGLLVGLIVALMTGAGFAIDFVGRHFPWLLDLVQ